MTNNTISDTFPTPRLPSAIAFDPSPDNTYTGINVTSTTVKAAGKVLPLLLPKGAER